MTTANVHTGNSFREGGRIQGIAPTSALPKYSFNAKELDEETGMYCYLAPLGFLLFAQQRQTRLSLCSLMRRFEARYYAPPVFTSRDPLMNEKPWLTPYHYCSNNPIGRVDPSGMMDYDVETKNGTVRKTFEDGFNGRIEVSKREFNKLERKHNRENGSYENYRDELKDKKGYTTGHPQGGIIFHQPKNNGYSLSVGASFYCIVGGSFDIGYARDGSGRGSLYVTGSLGVGLEVGVGINYSSIPAKTSIDEFADPSGSGSVNLSIGILGGNFSEGNDGSTTFGGGLSYSGGIKAGFSVRANKTILVEPIPNYIEGKADYYSKFGHIKR